MTKYKVWANGEGDEALFDTYKEAIDCMSKIDRQKAHRTANYTAKKRWTETGETQEGDDGAYTHCIEMIKE